ncbi:hypothetical protein OH491_00695 [Termitidicoccus mucosus]
MLPLKIAKNLYDDRDVKIIVSRAVLLNRFRMIAALADGFVI